ncbi:MAG: LysR family transcriptional regulator [Gluconacetobacter diazotrophicus]|nr:LysR family transcriptional regulator [Gluconacetobacter diazotrophicus]
MRNDFDLDRLRVLAVLLDEGSVSGAARRLRVSGATVSRALSRLRSDFNDPILVPSGREMVLTPRALELQPMVQALLSDARRLFEHEAVLDLSTARPSFVINATDAVMATFCGPLLRRLQLDCPGCAVRFVADADINDGEALRQGEADLYIGATLTLRPEVRRQKLLSARMRALVRVGHPVLADAVDPAALCRFDHVVVSRRGRARGPIDAALVEKGLERRIAMVLPSHLAALSVLAESDLVLQAPDFLLDELDLSSGAFRAFDFPFALPEIVIFQAWHPREAAAPLHGWLRDVVRRTVIPKRHRTVP